MAGPEADAGFLDELKALAASLGIQDQVRFLDFQPNVGPVFASLDCLVLPSKEEAFGIVLLEAMALGKPCIVTRAGGAIEAVEMVRQASGWSPWTRKAWRGRCFACFKNQSFQKAWALLLHYGYANVSRWHAALRSIKGI